MEFLYREVFGNPLLNWLVALLTFFVVFVGFAFLRSALLRRIQARAQSTRSGMDDVVAHVLSTTRVFGMFALAVYLASLALVLPPNGALYLRTAMVILLLLQMALWGNSFVSEMVAREVRRRVRNDDQSSTTVNLLGFFARVALWAVVVLLVLDNLPNVRVDTLVASLGVTGVAVAISLQRILGDVFSSISIALDKPFVIGDYIIVDELQGTVEAIGLKSTRVRSLYGEQIIVSNSDLLNSRIKNYKRMVDRRVEFHLKVAGNMSVEALMRIPRLVQELILAQEQVRFDRAHFDAIGDGFYDFEVVYWVLSPDYTLYKDIQQNINLAILNRFQQEGILLSKSAA